jgi:glyoxylase-like metal-dependent hydrolase (beta-lactamase superfamily II)
LRQLTFGRARSTVLHVGGFPMDAEVMFPAAPADERVAALARHGLPEHGMVFGLQALLVELDGHRALVDPAGLDHEGGLSRALAGRGVEAASIETVVITHGHFDHYASCIDAQGGPAFPRATIVLQRREWEHWSAPGNPEPNHARDFERLAPLRDHVRLLDGDGPIAPGLEAVLAPGHSPGHMIVAIDGAALHLGDVIQSAVQVEHPGWAARFDVWPEQVVATRRAILERLARSGELAFAPHLPAPVGRVERDGDAFRWVAVVA